MQAVITVSFLLLMINAKSTEKQRWVNVIQNKDKNESETIGKGLKRENKLRLNVQQGNENNTVVRKKRRRYSIIDNGNCIKRVERNFNFMQLARKHQMIKRSLDTYENRTTSDMPYCGVSTRSCKQRCINTTEWRTESYFSCFCDPDCYEVFNDCCSDYVRFCGVQKPKANPKKNFSWECVNFGVKLDKDKISDGVWMVTQCSPDWPHDNIRQSCLNPNITTESPDIYRTVPILNRENITFRNVYCALCNQAADTIDLWAFEIATEVLPPMHFNLSEQVRFYLANGAQIRNYSPKLHQVRRYCVANVIDTCSFKNRSCRNDEIQVIYVHELPGYLLNEDCARCNGFGPSKFGCFPSLLEGNGELHPWVSFSLVLNFQRFRAKQRSLIISATKCDNGLVFDEILQICTNNWLRPSPEDGPEKYYIISWLQTIPKAEYLSKDIMQESFVTYFKLLPRNFNVNEITQVTSFFLVKSTLILTPEQSLGLRSTKSSKTFLPASKLSNFIHFKTPWSLKILNRNFTVFKTTSRPLKCFGKKNYTSRGYTTLEDGRIFINATNNTYEKWQYFTNAISNGSNLLGNITLCEKYIPTSCGSPWTVLLPGQFVILENLSVYVNSTAKLYHYGHYEVLTNNSVQICISKDEGNTIQNWTKANHVVLFWITIVCFILSVISLIFLLITYIIFSELRTLPGKNLMNLATALLMSAVFWIISSFARPEKYPKFCIALIMIQHYFLIASFTSMSVIAFHTWKTFSKELTAPRSSEQCERKWFRIYLLTIWFFPAIFVGTCFIVDWRNFIKVGYGDSEICWFRHKDGYIYFTIVPNAISLLFNIITFLSAAFHLRKHSQELTARQCSSVKRSYFAIYIKLSSLMGFTWLFGLLDVAVNKSRVFEYLFVICTCLQGVFISMAFVFKKEILKMYKEKISWKSAGDAPTRSVNWIRNASMETVL